MPSARRTAATTAAPQTTVASAQGLTIAPAVAPNGQTIAPQPGYRFDVPGIGEVLVIFDMSAPDAAGNRTQRAVILAVPSARIWTVGTELGG